MSEHIELILAHDKCSKCWLYIIILAYVSIYDFSENNDSVICQHFDNCHFVLVWDAKLPIPSWTREPEYGMVKFTILLRSSGDIIIIITIFNSSASLFVP